MHLHLHISNNITFSVTELQRAEHPFLFAVRSDLELPNPEFRNAIRMGRYAGHIPEKLLCYEWDRKEGTLTVPRGYLEQLIDHAKRFGIGWGMDMTDVVHVEAHSVPTSKIQLRGYQVPAVDAATKRAPMGGVIVAPAGAGKTELMLEILVRLGLRALLVTNKRELATQFRDRAIARLGMKKSEIGMIGAGQERLGDFLTIGLVQTLSRRDLSQWANEFGVIVVDECHRTPASTFTKVVSSFPAHYRFGLTATPKRRDGMEPLMHFHLGPTIHEITRAEVQAEGGVVTPRLRVVPTGAKSEAWSKYEKELKVWEHKAEAAILAGRKEPKRPWLPYNDVLADLVANDERNAFIVTRIADWGRGHSNLVLTARVSHAEELAKRLDLCSDLSSAVLHGGLPQDERQRILSELSNGELDVLFAVDIPKEGLDVPRLDRLWFTAGGRDEIMVEQSVGRIQRPHPGKTNAMVIDFVDFNIGVLANQFYHRRRIYQRLGMDTSRPNPQQVALQSS